MARWFYRIGDEEQGPISTTELVALVRAGRLKSSDLVRKNESKWVSASKVRGLFVDDPSGSSIESPSDLTEGWDKTTPQTDRPTAAPEDTGGSGHTTASNTTAGGDDRLQMRHGMIIGNYRILETLGQGGMGVVLKAQHMRMDRLVAIKVLRSNAMQSPVAIKRFQQEVRAAARLSHPNIVTAFDADEVNGVHFLVMEYVNGRSLSDLLVERGKLSFKDALDYVLQTARGLEYAHSEGVIHRDIKPGNLLLDKRGTVKILDMGLASMHEVAGAESSGMQAGEYVTMENQLLGTYDYMPPEQAEDARSVDCRADIYALGCTMFRLLTGRTPYRGETTIKKILAHRDQPIPSIRELRPDVPIELDKLFQRMVAKRPTERYASMTEVIRQLEAMLSGRARPTLSDEKSAFHHHSSDSSHATAAPHLRGGEESVYVPAPNDDNDEFTLAAPSSADRYYWKVMGQETGPYTAAQLRKKKLDPNDLVRPEFSTQWYRAAEIQGLQG